MKSIGDLRQARTGVVGTAWTQSLTGLAARAILVEAVTLSGLPSFSIVGLPDAAVGEAKERVRASFTAVGLPWPNRRLTVNLSPGDVPKSGTAFDLAVAVAILGSLGAPGLGKSTIVLGELGLDGSIRPINGVIPACYAAARAGFTRVVVPLENAPQALLVPGLEVIEVSHLSQVAHMCGVEGIVVEPVGQLPTAAPPTDAGPDLADVCGQEAAVRGLLVAAAGGHHVLMIGPPGVGKSMLAERFPGFMPDLTERQAVEVAAIQSLMGEQFAVLPARPRIEAPHHSASIASLIGGGSGLARPGSITKAHHGVLYCDEFPEFSSGAVQSLRQPMESGRIELDRVNGKVVYPAKFQLVAAANPCRCGMLLDGNGRCSCTSRELRTYRSGLGGPVRDRIDITLMLNRPSRADLRAGGSVSSADASARIAEARDRQVLRSRKNDPRSMFRPVSRQTGSGELEQLVHGAVGTRRQVSSKEELVGFNRDLSGAWLRANTMMTSDFREVIEKGLAMADISMRGVDRILRVAWSIADLEGHDAPTGDDLFQSHALRQSGKVEL